MNAVAFAARQVPNFLFLIRTCEVELADVSAGVDLLAAQHHPLVAFRNNLIHRFVGIEVVVFLIHVGPLHGFADLEIALQRFQLSGDEFEKSGFTRAVRADNAHDAGGRQGKVQVVVKEFVAVGHHNVVGFDHLVTQARAGRNEEFQLVFLFFGVLAEHFLVGTEARFRLSLSGLGGHPDPLQLAQ